MQHRRRPRAVILTLPDAKQPCLVLQGRRYTLRNFSQEGIGLWVPPPPPFGLPVGSRVNGDIFIESEIYPVSLEIVHHSKRVIGLKITHKSKDLGDIFNKLLEPASYANELNAHPLSSLEDATTGYFKLWYQGRPGNELIVWYNEPHKIIVALQLCFKGYWVYRHQFKDPKTGHLKDESKRRPGDRVSPNDILIPHQEPDEVLLSLAAQYLAAVPPPLPGYRFWQFLEMGEQVYIPSEFFAALKVA